MSDGGPDASLELVQPSLTLSMPVLSMAPLRRWFLSMPVHPPAPLASFQTPSLLNLAALPTTRPRAPRSTIRVVFDALSTSTAGGADDSTQEAGRLASRWPASGPGN